MTELFVSLVSAFPCPHKQREWKRKYTHGDAIDVVINNIVPLKDCMNVGVCEVGAS